MITTDFFKNLYDLGVFGTFNISLKVGTNNMLLVSLIFTSDTGSPQTKKTIPPLIFRGTVDDFTTNFFDQLCSPLKKVNEFFVNSEQHQKAIDKANLNLAKSASKNTKVTADTSALSETAEGEEDVNFSPNQVAPISKEDKKRSYTDLMTEIDQLVVRFKYQDALDNLPAVADYPEKEKQILAKEKDIKFQLRQYSLLP